MSRLRDATLKWGMMATIPKSLNFWGWQVGEFLELTGGIIPKMGFILVVRPPDWFQIHYRSGHGLFVFPGRPQRKSSNTRNSPGEEKTGMTCGATWGLYIMDIWSSTNHQLYHIYCPLFKFLVCFFQYSLSFSFKEAWHCLYHSELTAYNQFISSLYTQILMDYVPDRLMPALPSNQTSWFSIRVADFFWFKR